MIGILRNHCVWSALSVVCRWCSLCAHAWTAMGGARPHSGSGGDVNPPLPSKPLGLIQSLWHTHTYLCPSYISTHTLWTFSDDQQASSHQSDRMVHYTLFLNKKRRWCQAKCQMDTKSDNFNRLYSSASSHLSFLVPSSGRWIWKRTGKGTGFYFKWFKMSLLLAKMWKVKFVKGLCHPINRTCLFNPGMYLISTRLVKKKTQWLQKKQLLFQMHIYRNCFSWWLGMYKRI